MASPYGPAALDSDGSVRPISTGYWRQLLSVGVPLWASDAVATLFALICGLSASVLWGPPVNHPFGFLFVATMAYSLCLWASGLYPGIGWHPARELKQLFRAIMSTALVLCVGLLFVSSWRSPYVLAVLVAFPLQLAVLPLCRSGTKSLLRRWSIGIPCYFLGARADVMQVYQDMCRFEWTMLVPAGRFCDVEENVLRVPIDDSGSSRRFGKEVRYLGAPERLTTEAHRNEVFWLFVVGDDLDAVANRYKGVFACFPEIVYTQASRSLLCSGSSIVNYGLSSGIRVEESLLLPWPRFVKRLTDLFVSGTAILLLFPLFALLAILVRFSGSGPIFFSHQRIGRGGRCFRTWKFRTMVSNADEILSKYLDMHPELEEEWSLDHKLKNDPRVTWIGKFLRKTSLDELPQLWNVFVGEMSLVGPRPIVTEEIVKYGETFRDYLRVTPGITGLWQISGRNNTTYAERLAYDEFYVRNWTPWLDLYILLRTVKTVIFCEGAY